jgi:hypothetical protein
LVQFKIETLSVVDPRGGTTDGTNLKPVIFTVQALPTTLALLASVRG